MEKSWSGGLCPYVYWAVGVRLDRSAKKADLLNNQFRSVFGLGSCHWCRWWPWMRGCPMSLSVVNLTSTCWGQLVIPTGLYSDRSIFRQVYIPTGRYSDRSLFRQVVIPTGRCSDRSIFRQVVIPTGRYSDRSIGLFWQVDIPTGLYSSRSIFRQVDIPTGQVDIPTTRRYFECF